MKNTIKTLDDIKQDSQPDVEILSLRAQVAGLKKEIVALQKDYGDLQSYFRDLNEVASSIKIPPQPISYKFESEKKVLSPCVAVMHQTDWHYGAIQEADEIEFMNSYSPEQCENRVRSFASNFLKWVYVHRSGYTINELVILDTGDNISGDIHRELSITNAFPAPVQAFKCGVLKAEIICTLSPHFEKVRVEFIVDDNHGRLTKKPQSKQSGLNNHNYTVGHVAKLICSNQKNVEFNIYESSSKSVEVANRRYLLTHGHGIMGWAGFPYYGIERKVSREALVRLWEPDYNKFHKCIMGHWHAPLAHPWYWIGGCVSGTDAFDHKQGRRSKPKQVGWMVHPKHTEFNRTEFNLKDD